MGKVLDIDYVCRKCGKKSPEDSYSMLCDCGGNLIGVGLPSISGTRDNFGISKSFKDENGVDIDNWRSWEKAGYRNPLETIKDKNVRAGIKRKIEKIKHDKEKGVSNGKVK